MSAMCRVACGIPLALLTVSASNGLCAAPIVAVPPDDFVIVSDDTANPGPENAHGCDEILVIDAQTGREIGRSHRGISPGRLAATSDGALILSLFNNSVYAHQFVRVMVRMPGEIPRWTSRDVGYPVYAGAAIAISPDDRTLLFGVRQREVEKHLVADITLTSLGRSAGVLADVRAAEIEFAPDSATAYVVDTDGLVYVVDVATMQGVGTPIPYTPVSVSHDRRLRNTFASLSPDGRYLVINTGGSQLNVVDTIQWRSMLVETPGLAQTRGLAFNYAAAGENQLAVHGHNRIAVYRFTGAQPLDLLATIAVPGQESFDPDWRQVLREDTLAWTGRGDGVIAAIGGAKEFRILDWSAGPPGSLTRRLDFDACGQTWAPDEFGEQLDVLTLNKRAAVPTPTPTVTASAAATHTATATATSSPRASRTTTPSPTPTATATATGTQVPGRLYLPLLLREECVPGQQHTDVALVIDASTSMRDQLTSTGRRKLDAAREAVALFVAQLDLASGDQAAIVQFNAEAALLSPLTRDRAELERALSTIEVARQTRIQAGIHVAREELASARHRAVNNRAMVVLTDGANNPEPVAEAEREAALARADGIRVFTVGLGVEVEGDALARMASSPADYFYAPDGEDLAAIYRRIAYAIPCPSEQFWAGR